MKVLFQIGKFIISAGLLFNMLPKYGLAEIKSETNNLQDKQLINTNYLRKSQNNYYILGPGDNLQISISRDSPELDTNVSINGEGTINLPLIKKVYISGLTIVELKNLLDEEYKKFVLYPSVEINIVNYRPIKIYVDGEINDPGLHIINGALSKKGESFNDIQYQFRSERESIDIGNQFRSNDRSIIGSAKSRKPIIINYLFPTLYDAIRTAGGITQNADLERISVIRKNSISNGGGEIVADINFQSFLQNRIDSQNIRIYDGDKIIISRTKQPNTKLINAAIRSNLNPKFINVFVAGRVRSPGLITIGKISTLNDAIAVAGGARLIKGKVRYISYDQDGILTKNDFRHRKNSRKGTYTNPYLKDGDLIIVGESALSNTTEIINEVTAPLTGLYSGYRIFELLFND